MIPYEYGFNEKNSPTVCKNLRDKAAFYAEFNALLEAESLADLLGSTLKTESKQPDIIKLEKTFGRSNVMFTVSEAMLKVAKKEPAVASWQFSPDAGIIGRSKRLLCIGCSVCAARKE